MLCWVRLVFLVLFLQGRRLEVLGRLFLSEQEHLVQQVPLDLDPVEQRELPDQKVEQERLGRTVERGHLCQQVLVAFLYLVVLEDHYP